MHLTPDELRDLAAFCARRFPGGPERARLAETAGVGPLVEADDDPVAAWTALLGHAQARGRLDALGRAMRAQAPTDPNLAAAVALLAPPRRRWPPAAVAAGVVVVGLAGWGLTRGEATPEPPAAAAPSPAAAPGAPSAPAAPSPAAAPGAPSAPAAPSPAAARSPAAPSAPAAPSPAPTAIAAAAPVGGSPAGCDGPPGAVVGYWYAGEAAPGAQGDTVTLTRGARVRADYPRRDNRYDAAAPERCALAAGDRVTLTHAPIRVDGARWWVPFAAGDLQP